MQLIDMKDYLELQVMEAFVPRLGEHLFVHSDLKLNKNVDPASKQSHAALRPRQPTVTRACK